MSRRRFRTGSRALLAVATAGCSFAPSGPGGSGDAPGVQPGHGQIVDDTVADFSGDLGSGAVVAARGAIEMSASVGGGLHARACDQNQINNDPTLTFAALETKCTALLGSGYAQTPRDYGNNDRPRGLGLASNDRFTILYDGEIFLAAGSGSVSFDVDDSVLAEVDDGTAAGSAGFANLSKLTVPVAPNGSGFYPIRVAWSEQDNNARLVITQTPLPAGVTQPILRAPVTTAPGVTASQAGFDWTNPQGTTSLPTLDAQFHRASPPFDVQDNPPADYVVRFVGQVLIDHDGPHTFAVATDGGAGSFERLWLDGVLVTESPPFSPFTTSTTTQPVLSAGWHDVVVDGVSTQQVGHDVSFSVTLADGSGEPAPIPSDHLRPVVAGGETVAVTTVPNLGLAGGGLPKLAKLALPRADGFTIDTYDAVVGYNDKTVASDWTVALQVDGGSNGKLADLPPPNFGPSAIYAQDLGAGLRGRTTAQPVPLAYAFSHPGSGAIDGGAQVKQVSVIATGHGLLPPPFPTLATYTSRAHATTGATQIVGVTLAGDLHGQLVTVAIAVGDDAASLGEFRTVAAGTPLALAAGKVLAYRLVLSGDGWHAPAIERVQIDYLTSSGTDAAP